MQTVGKFFSLHFVRVLFDTDFLLCYSDFE